MQFSVPQFIEFESKIVGPLTIRQFLFIAVPSLISFVLFFVLVLPVWILVAAILISIGVSFAFVKIAGRPLYKVVLYAFSYFWQPRLFLWKMPIARETIPTIPSVQHRRQQLKDIIPDFSKVGKLWQDLTTRKEPIPQREKIHSKKSIADIQEQYQVFRRITGEKEVARRVDYR